MILRLLSTQHVLFSELLWVCLKITPKIHRSNPPPVIKHGNDNGKPTIDINGSFSNVFPLKKKKNLCKGFSIAIFDCRPWIPSPTCVRCVALRRSIAFKAPPLLSCAEVASRATSTLWKCGWKLWIPPQMGVSINGIPKNGWFIHRENPIKMDHLGGSHLWKPPNDGCFHWKLATSIGQMMSNHQI